MKIMQKILSGTLVLSMVLSMLPMEAFAENISEALPTAETIAATEETESLTKEALPEEGMAEIFTVPVEEGMEPVVETVEKAEVPTEETLLEESMEDALMYGSVVASGLCGENLTWLLDDTGLLTISGAGEMENYALDTGDRYPPWIEYNSDINSVIILEGVTSIGDCAFFACAAMTDITIPSGVVSIGDEAFGQCESLSSITLPDSLTSIGYGAFMFCYSLPDITIPAYVDTISACAFAGCDTLEAISVHSENRNYSSDDYGVLFDKEQTVLLQAPGGFSGDYRMPDSVTRIEVEAFDLCQNLTSITITANVSDIGGTFEACSNLSAIYVDPENTCYSSDDYGVLFDKEKTVLIQAPGKISGIYQIPDRVLCIGSSAFEGCNNLTGVEIPEGVNEIDNYAFSSCYGLTTVTIPASMNSLGFDVFRYCYGLCEIRFKGSAPVFYGSDDGDQFYAVTATVFYPANDLSWTENVRLNYGGDLNWEAYVFDETVRGTIILEEEYIALKQGQTACLQLQVQPAEWEERLHWYAENETVAVVDDSGIVTAVGPGTTYVVAAFGNEEQGATVRCRVDVAESLKLDGIQLSTNEVTTELFSTDYAEFEILLELSQNMPKSVAAVWNLEEEDLQGVAIESALFTNKEMEGLFELKVLDDRRVAVVPTENAVYWTLYTPENKDVAGSYITAVEVCVDGQTYTSENMTLTVKRSKPKLKATIPTFNSFYTCQRQPITITGGTVTKIYEVEMPEWLWLDELEMELMGDAPQKNISGKAVLEVYTEEWRIPAMVTLNIKNAYKAPALKLSSSSVTLCQDASFSEGARLKLLPKTKGVTLEDLGVEGIYTEGNYRIEEFELKDGSFVLYPDGDEGSGKINLYVYFRNMDNVVTLPLSVKRAPVGLKFSKSVVTLNAGTGDSAVVDITATPGDYCFGYWGLEGRLLGSDKSDKLGSGELELDYDENGRLYIYTTELTPANAVYTLYLSAGGKESAMKITVTDIEPTLKLKADGNLDCSFPEQKITLTTSFKNLSGARIEGVDYYVTETKGKEVLNENVKAFCLTEGNMALYVGIRDPFAIDVKNTYMLYLTMTLADGSTLKSSIKIPVKQTAVSLKLSTNKLTLNRDVLDKATFAVTCVTKGYNFTRPVWLLTDNKGNAIDEDVLDISWSNGMLTVATTEATPYGASYKLQISPETGRKAVSLTIAIPVKNKSAVSGNLKVSGSLDVIRDGTALIVTPIWKNCNGAQRTEVLTIRNGRGEDVTDRFSVTEDDGKYILTRADALDHSDKYTATLSAVFVNGKTVEMTGSLKLKMGSAKLTMNNNGSTFFAKDRNSRIRVFFASADTSLNGVTRVELASKLADQFEIFDYGSGNFAIGFKDGKVPEKLTSVNLVLNVWVEGNETAKANVSLKMTTKIVR